jgi:hypothetical protein
MISVADCGFITGFTILAALLADLTLSPALVTLAVQRAQPRQPRGTESARRSST